MASVEFNSVQKSFGPVAILNDVTLKVASGEFVALVGPSGCGKSTLLRILAGLEEASGGQVAIDGTVVNDISPKNRGISMVFQSYALYPHMSVRENLAFPLKMMRLPQGEIDTRTKEVAQMLDLEMLLDRKPAQLSGGQKQRVAMGRAMARRPKVLLFDEPLSNLDAQLRVRVRSEIALLHKKIQATVIYVTHDQVEAMTLADRIAVLNKGHLEQVGRPMELFEKPRTRFVASFIGTPPMNFLPAAGLKPNLKLPPGTDSIGFRAEHTTLKSGPGLLKIADGQVSLLEPLGSTTHVHVRTGENMIMSEQRGIQGPKLNESAEVFTEQSQLYYFSNDGLRIGATA